MPIVVDEQTQVRAVLTALVQRFGEEVPQERIQAVVDQAATELYAGARVRTFVPVLIERRVKTRLLADIRSGPSSPRESVTQ
jgi:hypothetical protein